MLYDVTDTERKLSTSFTNIFFFKNDEGTKLQKFLI